MKLFIDDTRNYTYSIGEDGLIRVVNISQGSVIGTTRVISGKLCDMIFLKQ